jgi:hypothetical protein
LENRFWPDGIGSLEIIYMHSYPNRWALVKKIRIFAGGDLLRIPEKYQKYRYARISQHFYGLKNL